ncbi:MAG: hypothetical protein HKO62_13460, partial [Gammaproteobacteria bacterium]|nr:hypothetical protein [Gammaproteobacteria bacterium]
VWRWNRPIIGTDSDGTPHLRLEQRVMASGPSIVDVVANTMFSTGATLALARAERAVEESMTFTDCRNNFYAAARGGLDAKLRWTGREVTVRSLLLDELLPAAANALAAAGIAASDIDRCIHGILGERVRSGRNGSAWQRAFVATHGADFENLTLTYIDNQATGAPVHEWVV